MSKKVHGCYKLKHIYCTAEKEENKLVHTVETDEVFSNEICLIE